MQQQKQEKKEGYFSAFQASWKKAWEYKTLWLWGFLAATSGSYISYGQEEKKVQEPDLKNLTPEKIWAMLDQVMVWVAENLSLILKVFVFGLVLALLFWSISLIARGGLIRFLALHKKRKSWRQNGREIWREGKKSFLRLLKLDAVFFLIALGLFLLGTIFSGGIILWIIFIKSIFWKRFLGFVLALILLAFLFSLLLFSLSKSLADFLVVLLEKRPMEALWAGGGILRKIPKEFLKLLAMLFLAVWLSTWFLEILAFLCQAFFSGVELFLGLLSWFGNSQEAFSWKGNPEHVFFLSLIAIMVNGMLNVFKIDYKLWWLEKNEIIKPLKEDKKEELSVVDKKILNEELEVSEGAV